MELHNLKPAKGAVHKEKRIARGEGSGHGGTSTKGHKGQKARSGAKWKRGFEGGQTPMHRRLPKAGFKNINRVEFKIFNLDQLRDFVELAKTNEVSMENLSKFGFCKSSDQVKILARGEAPSNLTVKVRACSESASEKIKAAGGSVETI
ncbi:MAG: 50S ribosomal protein L15 [Saprospiraceae bacterium]|nr:50S ribosomal protein L15 [Saprospiraceae bacterium]